MRFSFVFFFLALSTASAYVPIEFLGNIDGLLNPDFKEASFSQAVSFWESGLGRKIRLLGDYGPEKKGRYCHFQISERTKDCPQDAVMEFTQRLFPAPTGDVAVNTAVSDPVSRLSPKIFGMMVEWYARNKDHLSIEHSAKLTEDLWKALLPDVLKQEEEFLRHNIERLEKEAATLKTHKIYNIHDLMKERERILQTMDEEDAHLFEEEVTKNSEKILETISPGRDSYAKAQGILEIDKKIRFQKNREKLDSVIANLKRITFKELSEKDIEQTFSKEKPNESDALSLAYLFIKAFVEALIYERENPGVYPEHTTIHNLMAFVYQKAGFWPTTLSPEEAWKEHVVEFLEAAPSLLKDPKKLNLEAFKTAEKIDPEPKDPLLYQAHWTQKTYEISQQAKWPNPFGTKQAVCPRQPKFSDLKALLEEIANPQETYSDCGESTLRSFFNIVLSDPKTQKVNLEILDHLCADHNLPISKTETRGLRAFYTFGEGKFLNPHLQKVAMANNLWSVMVVSHLKRVKYHTNNACNIQSLGGGMNGIGNMLRAIEEIMAIKDLGKIKPKLPNESNMDPGHNDTSAQESPERNPVAQKLNGLCHLFSRQGFQMTWATLGESEPHNLPEGGTVSIVFSINEEPAFTWIFDSGHFSMKLFAENWRKENVPPHEVQETLPLPLLSWYVSPETVEHLPETLLKTPLAGYALSDSEAESIIESVALMSKYQNPKFYPTALRWVRDFSVLSDEGLAKRYAQKVHAPWSLDILYAIDKRRISWEGVFVPMILKLIEDHPHDGEAQKTFFHHLLENLYFEEFYQYPMLKVATALIVSDQDFIKDNPVDFKDAKQVTNLLNSFGAFQKGYDYGDDPDLFEDEVRIQKAEKLIRNMDLSTVFQLLKAMPDYVRASFAQKDPNQEEKAKKIRDALFNRITDRDREEVYDLFFSLVTAPPHAGIHDAKGLSTFVMRKELLRHFLTSPQKEKFYGWLNENKAWGDKNFTAGCGTLLNKLKIPQEKEFNERKEKFLQDSKS